MTINMCVYGKVTKTNLVKRNSENMGGGGVKKKEIKKMITKKDKNFKIYKMSMGGNDTYKNKLVKVFNAKT